MRRTIVGRLTAAGAGVILLLGVAGCGSTETATPASASTGSMTSTSASDPGDVQFAQQMIPHHEQAVEMARLALDDRAGASAEVKSLAQQISTAQEPEIATMSGWMSQWGASTDMGGMDHGMDGMMSDQQMGDLAAATGADFDQQWLTMMIQHHEGAVSMAGTVLGTTNDARVSELARAVVQGQKAELATMQGLLRAP
ncbi:MAG: DUF305 domain-containing protein [Ornithinibacter sp.]